MPNSSDLDEARLGVWLEAHITGFCGPFSVTKFAGGQSNPTYHIAAISGDYVLRRKPFGDLLPSAHAVDREFRLIEALYPAGYPTPKPYVLCLDAEVIGSIFYIMGFLDGVTYWNGALPEQTPDARSAIYEAMIDNLAALHALDYTALGLAGFGKTGNYFERQVERWTKQYRASQTDEVAAMEALMAYLPTAIPPQNRVSIVHGDYRIDNMVFAKTEAQFGAQILGVLDWELATLGDPLADFTYFAMNWIMPHEGQSGIAGLDLGALGIPTLEACVARYCHKTGRDGVEGLDWYFAYNLFRIAAILQGVKKRMVMGNASSPKAAAMAAKIAPLSEAALGFAQKYSGKTL
jgi:aminoglycoside phosphotransferase (APT) family kinase protein